MFLFMQEGRESQLFPLQVIFRLVGAKMTYQRPLQPTIIFARISK
jgi:hypothetical protein